MGWLLYNIFLFFYSIGIRIAAFWNPKAKLWVEGRKRQWAVGGRQWAVDHRLQTADCIWFHCASLGEFEQGRPLLEKLREQYPESRIILSFFSPSGYEVQKNYSGADQVLYLPMDSPSNAKKFISQVDPSLVIWVKYEYWYYYLSELKQRNIPVLLVSGIFRKDQPFFKWYGGFWKKMLQCFSHLFVQTPGSKQLLASIGINENVSLSGDTRFDRVIEIAENFSDLPQSIKDFCGTNKVIVAGSTWEEDEEELDHYANNHPEIKFILAPHQIEEAHLKDIEKLFHHSVRYSSLQSAVSSQQSATGSRQLATGAPVLTNVLIIDNIGLLSRLYKLAHIAYIGGGFGADGVHNVLEAAVYGRPVIFGPEFGKYIEAVELEDCGGGISIENALELEKILGELFSDENYMKLASDAAKNYVYSKAGATGRIVEYIQVNRLLTS